MSWDEIMEKIGDFSAEELRKAKAELIREHGMTWADFRAPGAYQSFLLNKTEEQDQHE